MKRIFLPLVSTAFALMAAITFMSPAAASIDINFSDQNTYTISQDFYGPAIASEMANLNVQSEFKEPLSYDLNSELRSTHRDRLKSQHSDILFTSSSETKSRLIAKERLLVPLRI